MSKILILTISIFTILIMLSCCTVKNTNEKKLQKSNPFTVIKSNYNSWFGGQPGVKGYHVNITINNPKIELDSVFFRGRSAKFERQIETNTSNFKAVIILPNPNKGYNLDSNPKNEFGNTVSNTSKETTFQLEQNEAIISYFFEGKTKYTKITNLTEAPIIKN